MKILYLYAEIMGYSMATLKALAARDAEIHVVHWDHKKLTPYKPEPCPNVHMYNRSEMSAGRIQSLADSLRPDITVVSGWMDRGYMTVAQRLRSHRRAVVCGIDDQWRGTMRQNLAVVFGALGYFSRYFSHAWVSGYDQFEYVRRLGFTRERIVYDLYCADLGKFSSAYTAGLDRKRLRYPHRFLFAGRLEPVKGLDTLLKAWQLLESGRRDWELHVIGNGTLRSHFQNVPGIAIKDFMQPAQLIEELPQVGCFILPSRHEPWGVVVHECVAAGLPLILSDAVGAASTFLIAGMNGYSFRTNDPDSLVERMRQIIGTPDPALLAMGDVSHTLSSRITPDTSAANLLALAKWP